MTIRAMTAEDYEGVYGLWKTIDGFALRSVDDSQENIVRFLARNSGISVVAEVEGKIIGAILSGHDGRRGGLYHVCVHKAYRNQGIAHKMLAFVLDALKKEGISKVNLVAFVSNHIGNTFWQHAGWTFREDLNTYDYTLNPENQITVNHV